MNYKRVMGKKGLEQQWIIAFILIIIFAGLIIFAYMYGSKYVSTSAKTYLPSEIDVLATACANVHLVAGTYSYCQLRELTGSGNDYANCVYSPVAESILEKLKGTGKQPLECKASLPREFCETLNSAGTLTKNVFVNGWDCSHYGISLT